MMAGIGPHEGTHWSSPTANPSGAGLPHENLTYDDLLRIVELVKATEQFSEFRLKVGEIEIELRRRGVSDAPEASPRSTAPTPSACHPLDISSEGAARPPVPADPSVTSPERPTWPWGSIVIRSPMVGTF